MVSASTLLCHMYHNNTAAFVRYETTRGHVSCVSHLYIYRFFQGQTKLENQDRVWSGELSVQASWVMYVILYVSTCMRPIKTRSIDRFFLYVDWCLDCLTYVLYRSLRRMARMIRKRAEQLAA